MRNDDHTDQLVDLGDAVVETKGQYPVGAIDALGGFRQPTGLESED